MENFTKDDVIMFLRGSILGDMCIEKKTKAIINTQSIIHDDYVSLKHKIFSKYFNIGKIGSSNNWGSNPDNALRVGRRFRIYDMEAYEIINSSMYRNGLRTIPDISMLDYHSLFFWYLDDGSLISSINKKNGYAVNNLRIGLKSFKNENILDFIYQFNIKYNIKFNYETDKSGKIIRVYLSSKKDICAFLSILYPLYEIVPESLKYKFQPVFTDSKYNTKFGYLIIK